MNASIPAALIAKASGDEKAALRELLQVQASALVAHHVREEFWVRLAVIGIWALAFLAGSDIAHRLGYVDWSSFSADLAPFAQLATVLIFLAVSTVYVLGRFRLVRSEVDLLRLKLEWLAEGREGEDDASLAAATMKETGRRKGRLIDLNPHE